MRAIGRPARRHRALVLGGFVALIIQGTVPVVLHAATPNVPPTETADSAAATPALVVNGSGGGTWAIVATTTTVTPPPPPSAPPAKRIGIPITRNDAPADDLTVTMTDDPGLTADDTYGQEAGG